MKYITLKNKDLELRSASLKIASELFLLVDKNRRYLREWLPWVDSTKSPRDIRKFINSATSSLVSGKEFQFSIHLRGDVVGMIGLHHIDKANRKAMIGYWLDQQLQGQGIMTKACTMVIEYGFRKLKLNRIEIQCATGNKRSCAIPQRLKFKKEGVRRQTEWLHDHFEDSKIYGLLAQDWE